MILKLWIQKGRKVERRSGRLGQGIQRGKSIESLTLPDPVTLWPCFSCCDELQPYVILLLLHNCDFATVMNRKYQWLPMFIGNALQGSRPTGWRSPALAGGKYSSLGQYRKVSATSQPCKDLKGCCEQSSFLVAQACGQGQQIWTIRTDTWIWSTNNRPQLPFHK